MGALPKEDRLFTYGDFKSWDLAEGERYEIIYGKAYTMLTPYARHQEVLVELMMPFYTYLQDKPSQIILGPLPVRLFYKEDESDDTVVQPDIMIICDKTKLGPEGCRGAPDLIIEILSPFNTAIEMNRKLILYQEADVREYWVVDPQNKVITVYRFHEGAILNYALKKDAAAPVGIFPDLCINLEQVFAE